MESKGPRFFFVADMFFGSNVLGSSADHVSKSLRDHDDITTVFRRCTWEVLTCYVGYSLTGRFLSKLTRKTHPRCEATKEKTTNIQKIGVVSGTYVYNYGTVHIYIYTIPCFQDYKRKHHMWTHERPRSNQDSDVTRWNLTITTPGPTIFSIKFPGVTTPRSRSFIILLLVKVPGSCFFFTAYEIKPFNKWVV